MGRLAGASCRRRARLTRWAFAVAEVPSGVGDRTALVLPPEAVACLPWPDGAAALDPRGVRRRQVLAALVGRALPGAAGSVTLAADRAGHRRLAGTDLYASVGERSGWAAAVLARAPVGVDIEGIDEAEASAAAVLDGIATVDPAAWHGLAGVWAAREATLKAMGRDLTTDPGGWRFGDGIVTPSGGPAHRVDIVTVRGVVAAIAYVGG